MNLVPAGQRRFGTCWPRAMSAFILSGYPHLAECDLFARYVLPELNHGRLEVEPQPVVLSG